MSISSKDVLFYQAQDNTDNEEGGGYRSPNLIQDGVMNNLFNDISRLDSVGGDLNMRKVIRVVNTDDRSLYQGSHAIVRKNPLDVNVGAVLMHDPDPFSVRKDVVELIESYTSPGAKTPWYLEGRHLANSRVITVVQLGTMQTPPYVGQVIVIINNSNGVSEYVKIKSTNRVVARGYEQGVNFTGTRMICEITEPLVNAFTGKDFTRSNSNSGTTEIRVTNTNENLDFFGTTFLKTDVVTGDMNIELDDTYAKLLPTDSIRNVISSASFVEEGTSYKVVGSIPSKSVPSFTSGTLITTGYPILPGSISSTGDYADNGLGALIHRSTGAIIGDVDYVNGLISSTTNVNSTLTFTVGLVNDKGVTSSVARYKITEANQSNVLVVTTINQVDNLGYVQYRSGGVWYKSYMNGIGVIDDEAMTGTVVANGLGGSVISINMTFTPDINTYILYTFASDKSAVELRSITNSSYVQIEFELPDSNIDPATMVIKLNTSDGYIEFTPPLNRCVYTNSSYSGTVFMLDPVKGIVFMISQDHDMKMPTSSVTDPFTFTYDYSTTPVDMLEKVNPAVTYNNYQKWYEISEDMRSYDYAEVSLQVAYGNIETVDLSNTFELIIKVLPKSFGFTVGEVGSYIDEGGVSKYIHINGQYISLRINTLTVGTEEGLIRLLSVGSCNYIRYCNVDKTVGTTQSVVRVLPYGNNIKTVFNYPTARVGMSEMNFDSQLISMFGNKMYKDREPFGVYNPKSFAGKFTHVPSITRMSLSSTTMITYTMIGEDIKSAIFLASANQVKPGSLTIVYGEGNSLKTVNANSEGVISNSGISGKVNHSTSIVTVNFSPAVPSRSIKFSAQSEQSATSSNAVTGINAVRMPVDGRVRIFKPGYYVVVFDEVTTAISTPTAGQTITLARQKQAYIELIDVNGERAKLDTFTADRLNGTVTFATPLTLVNARGEPLTAPYSIVDRVEDMATVRNVTSDGKLQLSSEITRDYVGGVARVASCLVWGDSVARLYNIFTQSTAGSGDNLWSDMQTGSPTTAQYNNASYPMQVVNADAIPGRFMLVWRSANSVDVIHERMGVIAAGINTATLDVAPINPVTGKPIFIARKEGFGSGWSTGNILRLNIEAADDSLWLLRPVQPGALNENEDLIEIESRGDSK